MTRLDNSCEGTNAADIGTATIGGPNPFTTAAVSGTGATKIFDNTVKHSGSTAIKLTLPANVSAQSYMGWTGQASSANVYGRGYFYMTAAPTVTLGIMRFYNAGTYVAYLRLNLARTLTILDSAAVAMGSTSTGTIALSTLTRIEFDLTGMSGTTGTATVRVYSGANLDGATPDFTIGPASGTTGAATANELRFGTVSNSTQTAAWSTWWDDCAYSDTAQPGPVVPVLPTRATRQAVMRAANW